MMREIDEGLLVHEFMLPTFSLDSAANVLELSGPAPPIHFVGVFRAMAVVQIYIEKCRFTSETRQDTLPS